jgi:hypothetical protein
MMHILRLWDMSNEDNGVIALQASKGFASGDTITCISYSRRKGKGEVVGLASCVISCLYS